MIRLTKAKVPNVKFDEVTLRNLPAGWKISDDTTDWIVGPPATGIGASYFTNIEVIPVNRSRVLKDIVDQLEKTEIIEEHDRFIKAAKLTKYEHSYHSEYGFNAKLYKGKTLFALKPLDQINGDDHSFFNEVGDAFKIKDAVVFRKNIHPFFAMISLRKFAYQLPNLPVGKNVELELNAFWNAIPNPKDFESYIDPFFILAPISIAVPFDRLTSGVILIPENTLLHPFESVVGYPSLFLTSPSGPMAGGVFNLFGTEGQFSSITARRYVSEILEKANAMVEWLMNPINSYNTKGQYDEAYGIQILATVHGIFTSFSMMAKTNNADERLIHIFMAFDRISNMSVNFVNFKNGTVKDTSSDEVQVFKNLLTQDFFDFAISTIKHNIKDKNVSKILCDAGDTAFSDLLTSFKNFSEPPDEIIRTVRNTAHGAFLKKQKFLRAFVQGELKLSNQFVVVLYILTDFMRNVPPNFIKVYQSISCKCAT